MPPSDRTARRREGAAGGAEPPSAPLPPAPIVVMGVSGCGKTAVGTALAAALGARFVEGDRLHPPENVARMSRGVPLTDADRAGWLDAVGATLATAGETGAVASCSALKRAYRDRLRRLAPGVRFVYLAVDRETARRRVAGRNGHFMPANLVDSQFADLEPPGPDEAAATIDATLPLPEVVAAARAAAAPRRTA